MQKRRSLFSNFLMIVTLLLVLPLVATAEDQPVGVEKGTLEDVTPPIHGFQIDESHPFATMVDFNELSINVRGGWSYTDGTWEVSPADNASVTMWTGDMSLPTVTEPGMRLVLRFQEKFQFENEYDFGRVLIEAADGEIFAVSSRTGAGDWREELVDLSTFAGQTVKVGFLAQTDETVNFEGWSVRDLALGKLRGPEDPLTVEMLSLNPSLFPYIYMNISVDSFGVGVPDLTEDDFVITENGVVQTDCIQIIPPEVSGGSRIVDIIFVLDISGSMGGEIAAVQSNMIAFVNALESQAIDYRVGFVTFRDDVNVLNSYNLYSDLGEITSIVNGFSVSGGGDVPENQLEAMVQGSQMNFRPGAFRVEIMLTDAVAHEADGVTPLTVDDTIDQLVANNVTVYPVYNTSNYMQVEQYEDIAIHTGGNSYYIFDSFNDIIDDIGTTIGDTYVVRYCSSEPYFDGVTRFVEVSVSHLGVTEDCSGVYTPGQIPTITRTPETIALSHMSQTEFAPLDFACTIEDLFPPYVDQARLYYRITGSDTYNYVTMTDAGGGLWTCTLPGAEVQPYGLDYYIWCSDTVVTVTAPVVEPSVTPYQIAIRPNEPPVISDVIYPVEIEEGLPLHIEAMITDSTDMLDEVFIRFRALGGLIFEVMAMETMGGDQFYANIPAAALDVAEDLLFEIRAVDNYGVATVAGPFVVDVVDGGVAPDCLWDMTTDPALPHIAMSNGLAWGDFDGDGDEDLFLASTGMNALLVNNGTDLEPAEWDDTEADSRAASWVDYDGDGDLDLYVVDYGTANRLYNNDGGVLTMVDAGLAGDEGPSYNAAWADVDLDGDLDLFIADAVGADIMLLNEGGEFMDVDCAVETTGMSRGCAFGDYNNDGYPDLYVSKAGINELFRNDAGTFVQVLGTVVRDHNQGKGVGWADYDNDGDLDLYVANNGQPNKLYRNDMEAGFVDVTDAVTGGSSHSRGCVWGDYDNDGWQDLFIANLYGPNRLLKNVEGVFVDATCGAIEEKALLPSMGCAFADYDNDGDLDLAVAVRDACDGSMLFDNILLGMPTSSWLTVDLDSDLSNPFGVGAKVLVQFDDRTMMRELNAGSGYLGQSPMNVHFGLGAADQVDVVILWPSGNRQTLRNISANQHLQVTEVPNASGVEDLPVPHEFYCRNYPNPFNPMTRIAFGLESPATVSVDIYDVQGRRVKSLVSGEPYTAGHHAVVWNGRDERGQPVNSGVFFYRVQYGSRSHSGRMTLLK